MFGIFGMILGVKKKNWKTEKNSDKSTKILKKLVTGTIDKSISRVLWQKKSKTFYLLEK